MPNLPSGFAVLLFLVAAEPDPSRPIRPTQEEIERYAIPRPAALPAPVGGSPFFEISGFGLFAASAADFASTEWGLSRGLQEGNPVAGRRGIRLAHHVVGPAAVYWTTERLRRSGKTKLALGLRIALMSAYSYAAFHNLRHTSAVPGVR
jgi:hypothetical protein